MTNKKPVKDILKEVLTKEHDNHVPGLEELTQLIISHTMQQHPQEIARLEEIKAEKNKGIKKKSTLYLSEEVHDELNNARETIENLLPDEYKAHVTKSNIVDIALKTILREWSRKGVDSPLFKEIISEQKDK